MAAPPGGDEIAINVDPYAVEDKPPGDWELRECARALSNGRAAGMSFVRAEHIKEWLRGAEHKEDPEALAAEGAGDNWRLLVRLVQVVWRTGKIPQQLLWIIVVLLPKGGGDYRGIGLLEPIWKVLEVVMDQQLNSIKLHNSLHGF